MPDPRPSCAATLAARTRWQSPLPHAEVRGRETLAQLEARLAGRLVPPKAGEPPNGMPFRLETGDATVSRGDRTTGGHRPPLQGGILQNEPKSGQAGVEKLPERSQKRTQFGLLRDGETMGCGRGYPPPPYICETKPIFRAVGKIRCG